MNYKRASDRNFGTWLETSFWLETSLLGRFIVYTASVVVVGISLGLVLMVLGF